MTELVETEEEYVKKLGHVCEVSVHPNTGLGAVQRCFIELYWRARDVGRITRRSCRQEKHHVC